MKRIIGLFLLCLGVTACNTPQSNSTATAVSVEILSQTAAYYVVSENPSAAPAFQAAAKAIESSLMDGVLFPAEVRAEITKAIGPGNPGVSLAVNSAMTLIDVWYGEQIKDAAAQEPQVRAVLTAMARGLRNGAALVDIGKVKGIFQTDRRENLSRKVRAVYEREMKKYGAE